MRAVVRLIYFVAAAPLIAGCSLLFPYIDPYAFPYTDPYFSEPTIEKTYSRGSATIELTRAGSTETITLSQIDHGSYDRAFGAMATWENDQGWTVAVNAYDSSQMPQFLIPGVSSGDVTISLVDGHDFWTAGSYTSWGTGNGCVIDVWELSADKLAGRANCSKLRWTDGRNVSFEGPSYVETEEPFDVSITFEATPSPIPPGSSS